MTTRILAARVDTGDDASRLLEALRKAGVADASASVAHFCIAAPGQHDLYPIGGEAHHDEAGREAPRQAAGGAATGTAVGGVIAAAALLAPSGRGRRHRRLRWGGPPGRSDFRRAQRFATG